jgi:hypothetical protein
MLTGNFRFGAAIAAAVAAPEVFKHALRQVVDLSSLRPPIPELLERTASATVHLPPAELALDDIELGQVDFVSGGAITNCALHVLYRVAGLRMSARLFDAEAVDVTNLNRYMLCTASDVGRAKVDVLAETAPGGVTVEGKQMRVTDQSIASIRPMAPTVSVGTDNVPTRWLVQREWPAVTVVGATAEFTTITTAHRFPGPCAGCFHPQDDDVDVTIPTVSFVSFWAGLMMAARLIREASGRGLDAALELWPLRLDLPASQWWHPLQANPRCPVHCPASAQLLGI